MMYALKDLLAKMGAPEAKERGQISWHYFNQERADMGGFAEIQFEHDNKMMFAELHHLRENYEDDDGKIHAAYTESFSLRAEQTAHPDMYKITYIAFDGDEYHNPPRDVIELGLGIFHARALDISIRMIEQTFNKDDILTCESRPSVQNFERLSALRGEVKEKAVCTVIPFPVRQRVLVSAH